MDAAFRRVTSSLKSLVENLHKEEKQEKENKRWRALNVYTFVTYPILDEHDIKSSKPRRKLH